MNERIVKIEEHMAFQEDSLERMEAALTEINKQILHLQRAVTQLKENLPGLVEEELRQIQS